MSESEYLAKMLVDLVGNPIHVYSLMDRLVMQLPVLRRELANNLGPVDITENIGTLIDATEMPDENDLEGVTQAIGRIQFVYRLDPVEMARGKIKDVQTKGKLSAKQMMNIAERRMSGKQPMRPAIGKEYALAIEWAEGALALTNDKPLETMITRFLHKARLEHNNNWHSPAGQRGNYPNEEFFVRRIENSPSITTGRELRVEEVLFLKNNTVNGHLKQGFNIHDFYSLCRGETDTPAYTLSTPPKCKLTTKNDPYFFLAPLKLEVVSEEPVLHLYHEILTDGEISFMTTKILSQLQAASVGVGGGAKVNNERTQSSGWIWDQEDDLLYKLSKKTGKFAQLETTRPKEEMAPGVHIRFVESEPWQIGLYGPGGHYLPHFDAFDPTLMPPGVWSTNKLWVGSRIATVMFYLSDLIGGNTAFPKMGLAASPRKGTAVFWYNLYKDGNRDEISLHGACPTALGIKWVSNKWIREGAQLWKMPCLKKDR